MEYTIRSISMSNPAWSSLTDPDSGKLRVGLPLTPLAAWKQVSLHEGQLVFRERRFESVAVPPSLLEQFLGAAQDSDWQKLAQSFGPLMSPGFRIREGDFSESLGRWRRLRSQLSHLLAMAATLREGADILTDPFEVWNTLGGAQHGPPLTLGEIATGRTRPWHERSVDSRRSSSAALLTQCTRDLVTTYQVRPVLHAFDDLLRRFRFVFETGLVGGVGGAVVAQFLTAAAGRQFATCTHCGSVFVPDRKPAEGRRTFCGDCGLQVARKYARNTYDQKVRVGKKRKSQRIRSRTPGSSRRTVK